MSAVNTATSVLAWVPLFMVGTFVLAWGLLTMTGWFVAAGGWMFGAAMHEIISVLPSATGFAQSWGDAVMAHTLAPAGAVAFAWSWPSTS